MGCLRGAAFLVVAAAESIIMSSIVCIDGATLTSGERWNLEKKGGIVWIGCCGGRRIGCCGGGVEGWKGGRVEGWKGGRVLIGCCGAM